VYRFLSEIFVEQGEFSQLSYQIVGCNPTRLHFRFAKNPNARISKKFNTERRKFRQKDVCMDFSEAL